MIPFIKYRFLYVLFSGSLLFFGVIHIMRYGFNYSIDFVGGTTMEFLLKKKAPITIARKIVLQNRLIFQETSSGFSLRGKEIGKEMQKKISTKLKKETGAKQVRIDSVNPSMSSDNIVKTLAAVGMAAAGILFYISYTFKNVRYAVAAICALLHDTGMLLCAWSVLGRFFGAEFDLLFITALLTTMSFSVHDTIIIFDKVAEEQRNGTYNSLEETINAALTLTIGRSFNNSFTVVIMLTAIILLGGETIRWFAAALLFGTLFGTYSSPFIATPLFYFLKEGFATKKPV